MYSIVESILVAAVAFGCLKCLMGLKDKTSVVLANILGLFRSVETMLSVLLSLLLQLGARGFLLFLLLRLRLRLSAETGFAAAAHGILPTLVIDVAAADVARCVVELT